MSTSMLDQALSYAARGWPVFPCHPGTKQPLVKSDVEGAGGVKLASVDEAQIKSWWKRWPRAMIALPTGKSIASFVVDIDAGEDKRTGEIFELETLRQNVQHAIGCNLPPTLEARTPRGGAHLYFKMPGDGVVGNRADLLGKKSRIDVRGDGGYCIAPPSSRSDGISYAWINPDTPIAEAPRALLDLILRRPDGAPPAAPKPDGIGARAAASARRRARPDQTGRANDSGIRKYSEAALDRELRDLAATPEGGRNAALNNAALKLAQLVAAGTLDESSTRAKLEATAIGIGLTVGEARKTIESGFAKGLQQPRNFEGVRLAAGEANNVADLGAEKRKRQVKSQAASGDSKQSKQSDVLIELASEVTEYFHDAADNSYADIRVNDHRETWPLKSKNFKRLLARLYHDQKGGAPSAEALQSAIQVLEARALYASPLREIFVRIAGHEGKIYLDLADDKWRAIEVSGDGWRVITDSPVRFRRTRGMRPLPEPRRGGHVDQLRRFLNLYEEEDFVLVIAWLLACLRNRGPYPLLMCHGEQGTAKSTFCTLLRLLVDPNVAPLRALPREDRELFIQGSNGLVIAFDNISTMPEWTSDALCRIATGGGYSVRENYSDDDEVLFNICRPILMNGIADVVTRQDLADRAIFLTLATISDESRRTEAELLEDFERERPEILGALLTAVARGLRDVEHVRLAKLPRMADFALWINACETVLWKQGTFNAAYDGNRADIVDDVINADPIAPALRAYVLHQALNGGAPKQTAAELLKTLTESVSANERGKSWPQSPRSLATRLRRVAPFLRKVGVSIVFGKREGHEGARKIELTLTQNQNPPLASTS